MNRVFSTRMFLVSLALAAIFGGGYLSNVVFVKNPLGFLFLVAAAVIAGSIFSVIELIDRLENQVKEGV